MPSRDVDNLDRFWETIVAGGEPEPTGLDPVRAETVRRFHAARDVPGADPAFLARLMDDLLRAPAGPPVAPRRAARATALNGHSPASPQRPAAPLPVASRHRRWPIGQFATALLLVLTFGLAFLALGPGSSDDESTDAISGAVASETPPRAGISEETLLEIVFPAEALPRGEQPWAGIDQATASAGYVSAWHEPTWHQATDHGDEVLTGLSTYSILPGTVTTWHPLGSRGPLVEYVMAGTYTVRADAAITVVRADGTVEEIPADRDVTLGPGNALVSREETVVRAENGGEVVVELLSWNMVADYAPVYLGHRLPGWGSDVLDVQGLSAVPNGSATLRLRRVEVAPGATYPSSPGIVELVLEFPFKRVDAPTEMTPSIQRSGDGAIPNGSDEVLTLYVVTLEFAEPAARTPAA
jgi:hypothetical protein